MIKRKNIEIEKNHRINNRIRSTVHKFI